MAEFDEKKTNERLDEFRRREEEELASILAEKYDVEYIDLTRVPIHTDALRLIKEEEAKKAEVAAFHKVGKKIALAARSPGTDETKLMVRRLEDLGYSVTLYIVSRQSLERAWSRYEDISFATKSEAGVLDISGEEIESLKGKLLDAEAIQRSIHEVLKEQKSYRISRVVEILIAGALGLAASDIHVEPGEEMITIRYRLDGVLTDMATIDRHTYELVLSRLKLLSGLKLNIHNSAQDGRFSVEIGESDIEVRTSILPGNFGESIVLRVLDPAAISVPMEELGIPPSLLERLEREIKKPNGMLLNTGPTGSGKTTTLYAFLRKVHQPSIKVVTIEDPIEYHLPGIVQTQVDGKRYTFASGLRSTLRQDPDIIMVGEIRDEEVANTAVQAALTGHLVFSTLHTNNAAGTFPRLIDLGVDPGTIGSAVNVAMAQRLVRRLKPDMRREIPLEGKDKETVEKLLASIADRSLVPENPTTIFEAVEDGPASYKGRVGIFEAIFMDEEMEQLIKTNPSEREIAKSARSQGTLTMAQDGILKALSGVTSLSDLKRVIDIEEEAAMVE